MNCHSLLSRLASDRRARGLALGTLDPLLRLSSQDRTTSSVHGVLLMVMDSLHVVEQIVSPREAMTWDSSITALIVAKMWPVAVSMHPVSFSFMTEQACCGGKLLLGACFDLTAEGLEVGVDVFTGDTDVVSKHATRLVRERLVAVLIVALELCLFVRAIGILGLVRATIHSILVRWSAIQGMRPVATLITFSGQASGGIGHGLWNLRLHRVNGFSQVRLHLLHRRLCTGRAPSLLSGRHRESVQRTAHMSRMVLVGPVCGIFSTGLTVIVEVDPISERSLRWVRVAGYRGSDAACHNM